jgi:alpha-glucosidase (family GH31 glycosyl hydrolase)
MAGYQDFTINETRFPLEPMRRLLKDYNLHYIPIIDAGVAIGDNRAYKEGIEQDIFIKNTSGLPLQGQVWPGAVHYVDYLHPNSTKYWGDMLSMLYQKIHFSGIWLDMNEASNFCWGQCPPSNETATTDSMNFQVELPYQIGAENIE